MEFIVGAIVGGVLGNTAHEVLKGQVERLTGKSWEELYIQAFEDAAADSETWLTGPPIPERPSLNTDEFRRALHEDMSAHVELMPFSALDSNEHKAALATAMATRGVFEIGGHGYSGDDYTHLTRRLVEHATARFRELFLSNAPSWGQALLAEARANVELSASLLDLIQDLRNDLEARALSTPADSAESTVERILRNQVNQLGDIVADSIEQQLETMRMVAKEGNLSEAWGWTRSVRSDTNKWNTLSSERKARLLCFLGELELSRSNAVSLARTLADEAGNLAPTECEVRLRASIRFREAGPSAALQVLEGAHELRSLNLRAAYLLEGEQVDSAVALLTPLVVEAAEPLRDPVARWDYAETFRLQALAFLAQKEMELAQAAIQKAKEIAPQWVNTRFSAAVVDYFSALSPAFLPARLLPWPLPVSADLVKSDDRSLHRLRRAADTFQELQSNEAMSAPIGPGTYLATWQLACLATDPAEQQAATSYCRSIIEANPTDSQVLLWASARRLDIDFDASVAALSELIRSGEPDLSFVVALVRCLLVVQDPARARQVLEEHRERFVHANAELDWTFLYCEVLVVEGEDQLALEQLSGFPEIAGLRRVHALVLQVQAQRSSDWQPLLLYLEESYEATGDDLFLLDACNFHSDLQQWEYVADHALRLVEGIQTSAALYLAVLATYNTQRFEHSLSILNEHRGFFAQGRLPADLRQIRVRCQRELGILSEAITGAEEIAREEPTKENLVLLARLYLDKGDFRALSRIGKQFLARTDVISIELLEFTRYIQWDNQVLARALWRRALAIGVPNDAVGAALGLGFNLGLDREANELISRMEFLAKKGLGGFSLIDLEQLLTISEERQAHTQDLSQSYARGELPIHIVASQLHWSLVALYRNLLEDNAAAPDPVRQRVLLIRYGGRLVFPDFPARETSGRLLMDTTALLLAAELDLLDAVETAFSSIYVPDTIVRTLSYLREQIMLTQPSRLEYYRRVIALSDRGILHTIDSSASVSVTDMAPGFDGVAEALGTSWLALLVDAVNSNGYVVDFLPLQTLSLKREPVTLPPALQDRVINCRVLVDALRQLGSLSVIAYQDVLAALGTEANIMPEVSIPAVGSVLYCHASIPLLLAEANILEPLCGRFRVFIEEAELERARSAVMAYERANATLTWLSSLVARIEQGLETGAYSLLPSGPRDQGAAEIEPLPLVDALLCLMNAETQPGDLLWVDDRFVTSYSFQGAAPIVGINEILKLLVSSGNLTKRDYYAKLHRLRASNVRFVPLQSDEIVYHLGHAYIHEGNVIETPELQVLRRYVAACCLPGALLQRGQSDSGADDRNPRGESPFLFSLRQATLQAISDLWSDSNLDVAEARSNWVLEYLYVEPLDPFVSSNILANSGEDYERDPDDASDDVYPTAAFLSALFLRGLRFINQGLEVKPATRYVEWLWKQTLEHRSIGEPRLTPAVANILKKEVTQLLGTADSQTAPHMQALLQDYYGVLPSPIKDEWEQDVEFMVALGLERRRIVTVEGVQFDSEEFYRAATEAINGREMTISTLGAEVLTTFWPLSGTSEPGTSSERGLRFLDPSTGRDVTVSASNSNLELLRESPSELEAFLRERRDWIDATDATFNEVVAEAVAEDDVQQRMALVEQWWNTSAFSYYRELEYKLQHRVALSPTDLQPPSARGLLRHLRLTESAASNPDFAAEINVASSILLREEGLQEALLRLISLPLPLPQPIYEALEKVTVEERRAIIRTLLREATSPVARMHLCRLLLLFMGDRPSYMRLAAQLIKHLFGATGVLQFGAFLSLLKWADGTYDAWLDQGEWFPQVRLALVWAHANRLFNILSSAKVSMDWIQRTFGTWVSGLPLKLFAEDPNYSIDVARPVHIQRIPFLLDATAYSLAAAPDYVIAQTIKQVLSAATFRETGSLTTPVLEMVKNTSTMGNVLGSFLGGDRRLLYTRLLGEEAAELLSQERLELELQKTITQLSDDPNQLAPWLLLYVALSDLPPPPVSEEGLKTLFSKTRFKDLLEADTNTGVFAMQVATRQVRFLHSDEAWGHLKEELLGITLFLARKADADEYKGYNEDSASNDSPDLAASLMTDQLTARLFDWVYFLALASPSEVDRVTEFAETIGRVVDAWPALASQYKSVVHALAEDLPLEQAHYLWRLLLRLRAESLEAQVDSTM